MPLVPWEPDSFTKRANKENRSERMQFYVEESAERKRRRTQALEKTAVESG
jgi:hypothetical protein